MTSPVPGGLGLHSELAGGVYSFLSGRTRTPAVRTPASKVACLESASIASGLTTYVLGFTYDLHLYYEHCAT